MGQKKTEPGKLKKHTLLLFEGDYERANSIYENMPAAELIRRVLRDFLDRTEKGLRTVKPKGEVNL